ncbi:MAG: signal peptidase I [Blastocatellia bacterium]
MQAYETPAYQPPPHVSRFRKKHLFWLLGVAIALPLIYFSINIAVVAFVIQPVRIEGQAMQPSLNHGDKVFMLKQVGELHRGDIVVLLYPHDQTKSYIKRIIGLPGETIEIKDGKIYINGNQIEEPYLAPEYASQDTMPGPVAIPPDNYFVMGDNRKNSSDSRYWGPVPRKLIYGKFWYRYAEGKSE